MKAIVLGIIIFFALLVGFSVEKKRESEANFDNAPVPTLPFAPTTNFQSPGECVLGTLRTMPTATSNIVNTKDTCLPGEKSNDCKIWRTTNAIIMKNKTNVEKNCDVSLMFINEMTQRCTGKSDIQYILPQTGTSANRDCSFIYSYDSVALRRAMSSFNYSTALMNQNPTNSAGLAMFQFLEKISNCIDMSQVNSFDGAVLNIFTDIGYIDMCRSQSFVITFRDLIAKFIASNYVVKFIFVDQDLSMGFQDAETVLHPCKYNNDASLCEILDSTRINNTSFEICLADVDDTKKTSDINYQLIMIIGIPCLCLTICCISFFTCFLKCAKLKLALLRMQHANGQTPVDPKVMRRRKFLSKFKEANGLGESNPEDWRHFATANNYMDIHSMANANKEDVWEINTKDLLVQEDHLLGNGAFANVYKGILKGKIPLLIVNNSLNLIIESENNGHYDTAIKKLPAHADEQNRIDFFHEIEFMKRLGHHPHVISMLGCVSNPYEPLIVVEYCARGDLLQFLRRHKDYVLMNKTEDCPIEADMCLRIKDLVSIAWQVADGLSYLASKNFIHRDLAARNILLTKSLTAKISDFGLCRYIDSALYTAKGGRLPIKWMSTEALKLYEFSTKSDVWSYGVLLYEIFSLGDVPYPTIQQVDMLEHLLDGNRLGQPLKCPNEIYNIMERCWSASVEDRPEANEIRSEITMLLNLDDESYGYLNVESDDGLPKYRNLTMQEAAVMPTRPVDGTDSFPTEIHKTSGACEKLNAAMAERFGDDQAKEIKKVFCELFPNPEGMSTELENTSADYYSNHSQAE